MTLLTRSMTALAATLAACPSFQKWTKTIDPEEATEHIHFITPERNRTRTFALIDLGDRFTSSLISGGGECGYLTSGDLDLVIESEIEGEERQATLEFYERLGSLIVDLQNISATEGYLSIHEIVFFSPPMCSDEESTPSRVSHFHVGLQISWGP